ncbi:hypothetical protein GH5_06219 [Leishmania sp. Ghana 2012 LV757]|uniref:hypothetical protein n=1 Tax=Leishmania sp. Ghana 2012 LV757 TaxID=2803181 RepID=UPI001B5A224F|nr:hypothetical protein GH5_06219 [Leishmania sp. Ghana 2012 LV757]
MGCRASAVRNTELSPDCGTASPGISPTPTTSQLKASNITITNSSTTLHTRDLLASSMPTSPRYRCGKKGDNDEDSSRYTRDGTLSRRRHVHAQGDVHFAPPPPLSPQMVNQSTSQLTSVAFSTSDHMKNMQVLPCRSSGSASPRAAADVARDDGGTAVAPPREGRPESQCIPLRIQAALQLQQPTRSPVAKSGLPSRPSSYIATVDSEDRNATFRTKIDALDRTDSAQAAKEYQQHVQAKRSAKAAYTKRRQLEEFDPVRPVDSFNVTHRGLLGRCWDRRAPELMPVAFVHAMEGMLRAADETHPGSTTTSHPPEAETGRDEYPLSSPHASPSPLSHASGYLSSFAGGRVPSLARPWLPQGVVCGERRVPRRSHWFSVAGVSSEALYSQLKGNGSSNQMGASNMSPYYTSSGALSPTTSRPGVCSPDFPLRGHAKSLKATAASSPVIYGEDIHITVDDGASQTPHSLTPEQISVLPMEKREEYYNDFLARNPRFMGIKDCFAFRLADGVSEDLSTKFLRKRQLRPAPGVVAMRWDRVQLFQPTLHTLVRAVAMTQGIKLDASQLDQHQASNTGARYPAVQHSRLASSASANCLLHATSDDGGTIADMQLRRPCSQCVIPRMENSSFSLGGGGSLYASSLSHPEKLRATGDSSGRRNSNPSPSPPRNHSHQPHKESSGEDGFVAGAEFPEDSVLSLALGIHHSSLPQLMGASPPPQLGGVGRSRTCPPLESTPKAAKHVDGGPAASHGAFKHAGSDESVLVALSVSSFSVSIDPFRWQEHRYIRYPVDIDDSKKMSRHTYGEGVVTDVMYGGIMIVEASSAAAVKELQTLLASMTWTEGRTLHGVIGDVRKHLKVFQGSRNTMRQPTTPQRQVPPDAETAFDAGAQQPQADDEKSHRYRIWRRIGGRPMRDAVELQEISYFFNDAEVREETVTLNCPIGSDDAIAPRGAAAEPGGVTGNSAVSGSRHATNGSCVVADPDISPSFSRVASVWVKLPVIAAVLRTWGLHLLSNPELAQPIAMFLQRYTGIAPALQLTALGSLCTDGDTSGEDACEDADYLFFEGGGASVTVSAAAADDTTHPHPAPRIPEFNRFYASKSITSSAMDEHHTSDPGTAAQLLQKRPDSREVPTASLSPAHMQRCSDTKPSERGASGAGTQQQSLQKPWKDACAQLGSESQSREAAKGEAVDLVDSVKGLGAAPGVRSGGDGQSSGGSKTTNTQNGKRVAGRPSGAVKRSGVGAPQTLTRSLRLSSERKEHAPSRRSHADVERGSWSSSSSFSSFPFLRAVTEEDKTDFRGNPGSLASSSANTPCLQANKWPQPAFQKCRGKHRNGSTCAPSPSTPTERGKATPSASVPATPRLTAASRFAVVPSLSPPIFDDPAPITPTNAESSAMAATVGPESSAAAVASGKAMGPAAELQVSKVTFRSPPSPTEPQTRLPTASSSVNNAGADISRVRTRRATATPSTASEAAATATTAQGGTSAAAPITVAARRKGATATSKRGKAIGTEKKAAAVAKEAQTAITPSEEGVSRACHSPPSSGWIVASAGVVVNSATPSCAYHATEEEGLWHIAMLEVKAQKQELEDLRQARRDAEDAGKQREDELRSLSRILLPHTAPQELDGVLLYLKTALDAPEDMPHGRLFLHQPSWLPMLVAVWTAPSNRIRAVEIAAELTWMDIPRLGLVAGLLYHHHASGPLEELIIRSDKLLGSPRAAPTLPKNYNGGADLVDERAALPRKPRLRTGRSRRPKRGKGKGRSVGTDRLSSSSSSLHFTTELNQTISGFGPGCPPFFITPEEARDTLWLLLCSVAANATTPTFRVVLRGLPTGELIASGGGGGRAVDYSKTRTTSTRLLSLFSWAAARFRDENADARLLLKARSMTLDSFVVFPGSFSASERDAHSPARCSVNSAVSASMSCNTACDEGQGCCNNGSMQLDEDGTAGSFSTPAKQACAFSRQNSSFVIMSSLAAALDGAGGEVCSPGRHGCSPCGTFEATRAIGAVQTHQHRAQDRRAWMRNGNDIEERPFYKLLMHHCGEVDRAIKGAENHAGIAASKSTQLTTSPSIQHRLPFSSCDNEGSFHMEPDRQQRRQEAVSPSAMAPATMSETPSRHVRRNSFAHGLWTAEDEQVALQSEAATLREQAGEIWEALGKSVKHYNHFQKETHQKVMKRSGGNSSPSPPPLRQILLEY